MGSPYPILCSLLTISVLLLLTRSESAAHFRSRCGNAITSSMTVSAAVTPESLSTKHAHEDVAMRVKRVL